MEKLQAALAKARSQRGVAERELPRRKTGGGPPAVSDAWETLERVELSRDALLRKRIVSQEATRASESFDVLRTKAILQMQNQGWTRLAITSPSPGSGKTTVACNLALGLGRQNGLRTMLFDFDLGDPSVHDFFGLDRPQSMSAVLSGEVSLKDHALRVRENVAVVISPVPERDPTQLIMSSRMAEFLDETQRLYAPDIMIFDLPAVLSGDRARAFLKQTDCALIVAMADKTRFQHLDTCEREVAESTNVLGVVMNGCVSQAMPREDA